MYKICHMSSQHPDSEPRILLKECVSLSKVGYDVSYVVRKNNDEIFQGIKIVAVKNRKERYKRMLLSTFDTYKQALRLQADVYHIHDPELLPYAYMLKLKNKVVIYDVHEDVPRQILGKEWIPKQFRKIIAYIVEKIEDYVAARVDGIVTVTTHIANRFSKVNKNTVILYNYPIIDDSKILPVANSKKKHQILYISSQLAKERAIFEIVDAMNYIDCKLVLAGRLDDEIKKKLVTNPGWKKTEYLGYITPQKAIEVISESKIGLFIFNPSLNAINGISTKLFEYMLGGLPVVISEIPSSKEVIEKFKCGILIKTLVPKEIATIISELLNNPQLMEEMGHNGQKAVLNYYSWASEEKKLIEFYKKLL